jgi:hypothetical protein
LCGLAMGSVDPVDEAATLLVLEVSDEDEDEVDRCPDAHAPKSEEREEAGADLADIKAVDAKDADEKAKQECGETELRRYGDRRSGIGILHGHVRFPSL